MQQEETKCLINKSPRLSDAFPPTSINNSQYLAECHNILQTVDLSKVRTEDITFRQMKYKKDLAQIKELHKEWFPINYSQSFYDQVFKNQHLSLVAELTITHSTGRKEQIIIGCMFFRFKKAKSKYMPQTIQQRALYCLGFNEEFSIYIMTLGVLNEFRGKGIAQKMLEYLKKEALDKQKIKYIYLDMVTYNNTASRFYEKNDFIQISSKKRHYTIEEQKYDAYVYIWYCNPIEREQIRKRQLSKKDSILSKIFYFPISIFGYFKKSLLIITKMQPTNE